MESWFEIDPESHLDQGTARLEFGEDEFSINFNIKDSFSFRHQFNITDLHFLQFCRDTLRIRKVVSHGTVDDFYFHDFTFSLVGLQIIA